MYKKLLVAVMATSAFFTASAFAHEHGEAAVARAFIKDIMAEESAYVDVKGAAFFQELAKGQHPRATVVTCSSYQYVG